MQTRFRTLFLALTVSLAGGAQAQYIARKLDVTGWPQSATSVSGDRAVGTFGYQAGVRHREDAMLWDIRVGAPTFPVADNRAYHQISGDWVLQSQFDFSVINVTSNRSYSAYNLVTGQAIGLGTSAAANNSALYTSVVPNLREGWAFTNTDARGLALGYYNTYSSTAVHLATGQSYSFTWGPLFSSFPRQILDISGSRALVNLTATGYGFLNLTTGDVADIATGLSSVAGMSGNWIVGSRTGTGAAALYEIGSGTTRNLAAVGTAASAVMVGANQTVGTASVGGLSNAVFWDNASGAATNLHGYLPAGYASSAGLAIDKNFADGPLLISATTAGGLEDRYALRRFTGAAVEVDAPEVATFTGDHEQSGGTVVNRGEIRWTNPGGVYRILGGTLGNSGTILGGIDNVGGAISGLGGAFGASGGYVQGGGANLLLTIGGGASFDTFTFGGAAQLAGDLTIALSGGFVPTPGQRFEFFAAPGVDGAWDRIVSPGYRWRIDYTGTGASATFLGPSSAAPEPSSWALVLLGGLGLGRLALRRRGAAAAAVGLALVGASGARAQDLYVAVSNANTVLRVTPGGATSTFAAGVSGPRGLAFSRTGDLYVASAGTNSIVRITPGGVVSTFATGLDFPYALAFSRSGDLYVSNLGTHSVSRITPGGVVSTFATGFSVPVGLAFSAAGDLYVANNASFSVSRVTPGGIVSTFAAGLSSPGNGLAFASSGDLFVADGLQDITRITPGGVSRFATGLSNPQGMAFSSSGDLFVANNIGGALSRIAPDGGVSTVATGFVSAVGLAISPSGVAPEPSSVALLAAVLPLALRRRRP